jgi:two-component system, OmpR family, response regulator
MRTKHILLVEDDHDVRLLMQHVLIEAGYTVDAVGTVQAGQTHITQEKYDLVLVDGLLPDGTGLTVADDARCRAIPAIVVTAYAFTLPPSDLARYELLLKPARPHELLQAVQRSLDWSDSTLGRCWDRG